MTFIENIKLAIMLIAVSELLFIGFGKPMMTEMENVILKFKKKSTFLISEM